MDETQIQEATDAVAVVDEKRRVPWFRLLSLPNPYSKKGGMTLVVTTRAYRSKWTRVMCFCKKARKDGSCKTLDALTPLLAHPERVIYEHKPPTPATTASGRLPGGISRG